MTKTDNFFAAAFLISLFVTLGGSFGFVNVLVVIVAIAVGALLIAGLCWLLA